MMKYQKLNQMILIQISYIVEKPVKDISLYTIIMMIFFMLILN